VTFRSACLAALLGLMASCTKLNTSVSDVDSGVGGPGQVSPSVADGPSSADSRGGIAAGSGMDAQNSSPVGAMPPSDDDGNCPSGSHLCSGKCASDTSTVTCGSSCEPCPTALGGTTMCDGRQCQVQCPTGKKVCLNECVPEGQPCSAGCDPGFHMCGGLCVDDTKVANCGASCSACPQPPPGGTSVCENSKCDVTCTMGKRCGDKCGECCIDADCPATPGKVATCDPASLRCRTACPAPTKDCNGQCVAGDACCKDSECPMMAGRVGKCDTSMHSCQYACAGNTKPCAGKCIDSSGCCDESTCGGNFACVNNSCSTNACKGGFKLCNQSCIANSACCQDQECVGNFACVNNSCSKAACASGFKNCAGKCIPANGCCVNTDCGTCQKCVGNQCVNQSNNEDLKTECSDNAICKTGKCDGRGGCANSPNGQDGPQCTGECRRCNNGSCDSTSTNGQNCGSGRRCTSDQRGVLPQDKCQGGTCEPGTVEPCSFKCTSGSCISCPTGNCDPDNNKCLIGQNTCSGTKVSCLNMGTRQNGASCGTDRVCSDGVCVGCKVGATCGNPTECESGRQTCDRGPSCTLTPKPSGTNCGGGPQCNGNTVLTHFCNGSDNVCHVEGHECIGSICNPQGTDCL
jgi:hypothetical protein